MLNVEPGRHIDHQFREEEGGGGWEGQNRNELGKKNIPSFPFFSKKKNSHKLTMNQKLCLNINRKKRA